MLIYLYGKDSYRRKKKLSEILEKYKTKHENADIKEFNFDEDESEWKEAKDFLKQPSMFTDSKIAVVKEGTKVDKAEWLNILKEHKDNKNVFVLITDSSKKPKKKFKFLLDDEVRSQEFEDLEGKRLSNFLKKTLKEEDVALSKKAGDFMLSYLKSSKDRSWLAVNEVKKIALAGFEEPVSLSDVESIIPWSPKGEMYNETRKLLRKGVDPRLKLPVLERLIVRDEADSYVFNMLGVQVKGRDSAVLADLDTKIKSGKLDYEEALLDFVLTTK